MKHFKFQGNRIEPKNKTHIEEIDIFLSDVNNNEENDITDKSITIIKVKRVIS